MPRDLGIADRLRAEGLRVVEVDGWSERGSSTFNPKVSVNHHTAGAATGNAPSLRICIYGRSDLPGPLCQVFQARDNTIYVIASGRANHAGTGGWKGYSGNTSAWGLEVENVGTTAEPWRPDQVETMVKVHRALIKGRSTAEYVCQHREWTTRKPDAHSLNVTDFRRRIAAGSAPQEVVKPMYDPPHNLGPVVAELTPPDGRGVWLLDQSGAIYAYGGAQHHDQPYGKNYWGFRKAARLDPSGDGRYVVVATSGERYGPDF